MKIKTKVDILVSNAGIDFRSKGITNDGLDKIYQVNYLSGFLLIHLLNKMNMFKTIKNKNWFQAKPISDSNSA